MTSADRPFTETERAFLEQVRGWGKKVVIVINKIDILEHARDVDDVRDFVADNAARAARLQPGDLSGQRAPGAARQAGRAAALGPRAASRRSSATSPRRSTRRGACISSCSIRWVWARRWSSAMPGS